MALGAARRLGDVGVRGSLRSGALPGRPDGQPLGACPAEVPRGPHPRVLTCSESRKWNSSNLVIFRIESRNFRTWLMCIVLRGVKSDGSLRFRRQRVACEHGHERAVLYRRDF